MNRGAVHREQVHAATTVLALLCVRADEATWRARIERGEVTVDGVRAFAEQRVKPGQWLAWHRPPWEEPPAPLSFAVLHDDGALLAVAKPSGLPTLPGGGFHDHTLLELVRRRAPDVSPMHRLGRGTSGIVLFARKSAQARVSAQFRERRVRKVYRALCTGAPAQDAFTIDVPIGPVPHPLLGTLHAASAQGKPARSHVRVLRRGEQSLVEVEIETGRPHQIRIHLAAAGHALVGDPLYGRSGDTLRILPGDTGYLLHAMLLELPDVSIWCAPPPQLRT